MRARYGWLVMAVGLAACEEAVNGPEISDPLNRDVAIVAADATIADLQAVDALLVRDLTESRERTVDVTFYDAEGNEQEGYDPITTARIERAMALSRSADRDGWSAAVTRSREMVVTGLEGEETERTINGSGTDEVSRSRHTDADGTRTYEMSGTVEWSNLVQGVPRESNPHPLSGSVTRSMTVVITNGPNGDETRERTVVITFNGTQFATLTVDGETMEVDLSSREGRSPFRRPGR